MKIRDGGFPLWFPRKRVCTFILGLWWRTCFLPGRLLHNWIAFSGQAPNFPCFGNNRARWHSTFPKTSMEHAWMVMLQPGHSTSTEDARNGLPTLTDLLGGEGPRPSSSSCSSHRPRLSKAMPSWKVIAHPDRRTVHALVTCMVNQWWLLQSP